MSTINKSLLDQMITSITTHFYSVKIEKSNQNTDWEYGKVIAKSEKVDLFVDYSIDDDYFKVVTTIDGKETEQRFENLFFMVAEIINIIANNLCD